VQGTVWALGNGAGKGQEGEGGQGEERTGLDGRDFIRRNC